MSPAPLLVRGCGMTTAVGLTAPASCAAIRARLDGFRETRFVARGGTRLVGAEVPLEEAWRGLARLARLAAGPLRECLDAEPGVAASEIPLLLCVAEPGRPGRIAGMDGALLPLVAEALEMRLHPASRSVPMGPAGGGAALREAARMLAAGEARRVVLAGVDSYLVAATLAPLDARDRLLTERNSNGFIPGEAGAAVLLGADDDGPGLRIRSLGLAIEAATIEGEAPLRGEGLAAAYRQALQVAGLTLDEVDYRMTDLSGEEYGFREASLAESRLLRHRREEQPLWHPADCVGETGAAVVPLMLGIALTAARKRYAPGPLGLLHASNDDGRRVALVLDGSRGGQA